MVSKHPKLDGLEDQGYAFKDVRHRYKISQRLLAKHMRVSVLKIWEWENELAICPANKLNELRNINSENKPERDKNTDREECCKATEKYFKYLSSFHGKAKALIMMEYALRRVHSKYYVSKRGNK